VRDLGLNWPSPGPERAFLAVLVDEHFVPRNVLAVDQWADENRVLPRETSAEPGPWRTARTPYARQIMRDLSEDSPYEDVVLMMATQLVKSEIGLNWLGSIIDQTPAPIMIVQATVETGKRYSRQRIAGMLKACPALRGKVKDARDRDAGNTLLMKEFPGGLLVITGSNSAPGLASMPCRFIHFDERDDYPDDAGGQGEPTSIARARQDRFFRRKRLYSSSPKRAKGRSHIERQFQAGTRFYFNVPCPHCGAKQRLEFERLTMSETGRVAYLCPHCGTEIEEHHKTEMFDAGEWTAEAPDAAVRSYHLNSLYSPLGGLPWREILQEYKDALAAQEKGDDGPMKAFYNTRLALTWEEKTDKIEAAELEDSAELFPLRIVPDAACVLTAGIDVQDNRFEIAVYAWGPGEESWTVDYASLMVDPSDPAAWIELGDYLETSFEHESGAFLPIRAAAIDTGGHFTHAVYEFSRARARARVRTFAIKGSESPGLPVHGKSSLVDVNSKGRVIKRGVRLWHVGTDTAKDLLHNRLRSKAERGGARVHLSKELQPEFFTGMTAEHRVRRKLAHREVFGWEKTSSKARNEPWDTSVYALFAAHAINLHKWTPRMWELERARALKGSAATTQRTGAEPPKTPVFPLSAPVPVPKSAPRSRDDSFGSPEWEL
jgi:phage terminase large subunit GpA-like protein